MHEKLPESSGIAKLKSYFKVGASVVNPAQRRQHLKAVPAATAESQAIEVHAHSMDGVAMALQSVADEMKASREQAKPMHDFFEGATDALACVRQRAAKWGPWFLASIPFIISLVNGVSPQAAKLVQAIVNVASQVPHQ